MTFWALRSVACECPCLWVLSRVGIAMRNLPEFIVSYIAVVSIGGVAVLLNAWWTPKVPSTKCIWLL